MIDTILLTTEYLGPISSYALMSRYHTLIEYHENYQKKSYRNRCYIATPAGVELLSVPLKSGKNSRCPISEVEISYESDWISAHLQSLSTYYGSSPYYEYYIDDITEILLQRHNHLLTLNTVLLEHLVAVLDIETHLSPTETFEKTPSLTIRDLRKHDYKGRNDVLLIEQPYQQVWFDRQPFMKDLSIVDLLFCKGPESILYLDDVADF